MNLGKIPHIEAIHIRSIKENEQQKEGGSQNIKVVELLNLSPLAKQLERNPDIKKEKF